MVRILVGLGCKVLAYDVRPNPAVTALGVPYMGLDEMLPQARRARVRCVLRAPLLGGFGGDENAGHARCRRRCRGGEERH